MIGKIESKVQVLVKYDEGRKKIKILPVYILLLFTSLNGKYYLSFSTKTVVNFERAWRARQQINKDIKWTYTALVQLYLCHEINIRHGVYFQ